VLGYYHLSLAGHLTKVFIMSSRLRFSRAQTLGALALLAVIWLVIIFRLFFSRP